MFYHLVIEIKETSNKNKTIYLPDISNIDTVKEYGRKYNRGIAFYVDGYRVTPSSVNRFKIVETDANMLVTASKKREAYRRSGIGLLEASEAVLTDRYYSRDITSSILEEDDNSYVENETLDSGRLISDQIKREVPNNSHTVFNGPVIYGNVTSSQVVNSIAPFPSSDIFELLKDIKESIKNEQLTNKQNEEASEIISDIEESVKQQKKPSIIKNALKGLKDWLTEFGANVTAKLIEDKCNGLW